MIAADGVRQQDFLLADLFGLAYALENYIMLALYHE